MTNKNNISDNSMPDIYRRRAQKIRALAEDLRERELRQTLEHMADDYEAIATSVEEVEATEQELFAKL